MTKSEIYTAVSSAAGSTAVGSPSSSSATGLSSEFNPNAEVLPPGSIVIDSVSKRFRKHTLTRSSYTTVKSSLLSRLFQRRFPKDNFLHALKGITVIVPPGGAVGLIGSNGSGKSTMLKLIAGIYRADSGRVAVNGRISALIELGAGFHPDFSGRENIYLGGVMYGLTKKEIDARFDEIVKYAELEDFIDDPVRTYSSGMYMRLGFSLAVHTDPDILLVDEVLAVGDATFVHRCQETISEFKRRGKTLIFVTHDLESVARWCDEVIWLEKGVVRERGEPRYVIDCYLRNVEQSEERELEAENATSAEEHQKDELLGALPGQADAKRWGNREVEITAVRMVSQGDPKWVFHEDDAVRVEVDYKINRVPEDLVFGIGILRADGLVVHGTNTELDTMSAPLPTLPPGMAVEGESLVGTYSYTINRLGLVEGSYFLDVAAHRDDGLALDYHHLCYRFSVRTQNRAQGVYIPEHSWDFKPQYAVMAPRPASTAKKKVASEQTTTEKSDTEQAAAEQAVTEQGRITA